MCIRDSILTGAERSTNSRPVAVMVNNIANSQRQNARPQRLSLIHI